MRRPDPAIRTLLLDNNVFVAATRNPRRMTETLRLILKIVQDRDIRLVGNELLVEEMARYAEAFGSRTAALILGVLASKMEVLEVRESLIRVCRAYMRDGEAVDVVLAATCLQAEAVLITNDRHFDRIRDEGIIKVWSIAEAISNLL